MPGRRAPLSGCCENLRAYFPRLALRPRSITMPYGTGSEDVKPHIAVEPLIAVKPEDDDDEIVSDSSIFDSGSDDDEDDVPLAQQLAYNNQRDVRRVRAPKVEPVERAGCPFMSRRLPDYTNKTFTVGGALAFNH